MEKERFEELIKKPRVGNQKSIYRTLGASNHVKEARETNDYYATPPEAVEMLLELETFTNPIWEPACGEGHISKELEKAGYDVVSTDLVNRGFGTGNIDFLTSTKWTGDIITNPPYKHAQEFVEKALSIIPERNKVAMFLKLQFLEGQKRKLLFAKNPPRTVWVSSSRLKPAKNAEFDKGGSSAIAYCWFVWEKGYEGDTVVRWFN